MTCHAKRKVTNVHKQFITLARKTHNKYAEGQMSIEDIESKKGGDHQGKCLYLLTLIKMKNKKKWQELKAEYDEIELDETWDYFIKLRDIYQELS